MECRGDLVFKVVVLAIVGVGEGADVAGEGGLREEGAQAVADEEVGGTWASGRVVGFD